MQNLRSPSPTDLALTVAGTRYALSLATELLSNGDRGAPLFRAALDPQPGVMTLRSMDVSQGCGSRYAKMGYCAFGVCDTSLGYARPGPYVNTTAGTLASPIRSVTRHKGHWWVGTEAGTVHYWNHATSTWATPANSPSGANPITDLVSFGITGGASILIAFKDTAAVYQYTADEGAAAWSTPINAGPDNGKHGTVIQFRGDSGLTPKLVFVNDPNTVHTTADPRDFSLADTVYVGDLQDSTVDHFTSVAITPDGQKVLIGKQLGLWAYDPVDGTVDHLEDIQPESGLGMENFAWWATMGGRLYSQVIDYDMIEVDRYGNKPAWGLGPLHAGQHVGGGGVPEMKRAIAALTSDDREWIYAGLEGTAGYVVRGRYQEDGRFHWHPAICAIGEQIGGRMWLGADPAATDTNVYLWISRSAGGTPFRVLIPQGDAEVDTDARFATGGWVRYGFDQGGSPDMTKVYLRTIPQTRNLGASPTVALSYRTELDSVFLPLNTFNESPEPLDGSDCLYPSGVSGKGIELKATFTNTSTQIPVLESLATTAVERRPSDSATPPTYNLAFTVDAEQGLRTAGGAVGPQTAVGVWNALKAAAGALLPVTVALPGRNGLSWYCVITSLAWHFVKEKDGRGDAVRIDVTAQEVLGGENPAASTTVAMLWQAYGAGPSTYAIRRGIITNTDSVPVLTWDTAAISGFVGEATETITQVKSVPRNKHVCYVTTYERTGGADSTRIYRYDGTTLSVVCTVVNTIQYIGFIDLFVMETGAVVAVLGKTHDAPGTEPVGFGEMGIYYAADGINFTKVGTGGNGAWSTRGGPFGIYVAEDDGRWWSVHSLINPGGTELSVISYSDNLGVTWTDVNLTALNGSTSGGDGRIRGYPAKKQTRIQWSVGTSGSNTLHDELNGDTLVVPSITDQQIPDTRQGYGFEGNPDVRLAFAQTTPTGSRTNVLRNTTYDGAWGTTGVGGSGLVGYNAFSIARDREWAAFNTPATAGLFVSLDQGLTWTTLTLPALGRGVDWIYQP